MKYVNQPVRKTDAMSLVTGKPVYTDDLAPRDCLIVKILRSPHANAWVEDIKTGTAEKVAGIACILTYKDVPQKRFTLAGQTAPEMSPDDRLILDRHVRFVGDEMMYTKLSSGETYDVLIPSDYMIERLIKEEYLQALDWKEIPNKKNLLNDVMNQSYDPGNRYSCPYFWGTVGILYDKTVVDEADLKDGWNLLCNPKYKGNIYMYDSERDSFMIALKALGYSMNTTNESEIEEAYQWLIDQRDTMDPIYAGDDVIDNMISGNKALAVVYSGDASYIISENPNLDYFTPEQGTNRWYDAMVITKDCSEVQLAHEFIDFMISDKSALSNTEEGGYTSTVKSAFETMKEGDYAGISSYIPDTTNSNNEIFAYQQPKIKQKFAELWTKVKAK